MRLHRFYIRISLAGKNEIKISDENILHQMRDVFRMKIGDEVILFDGGGIDFICSVVSLTNKEGVFKKISEENPPAGESSKNRVTLLMSLIKKENFELVAEKATELGVSEIVPIVTARTLAKKLNEDRLQKIIIEASEQCGRGSLPSLHAAMSLVNVLQKFPDAIAFDLSGKSLPAGQLVSSQAVLIGPEGGWTESELKMFKEKNICIYRLGSTTLRAETAAIVACAKLLSL